jgi:hypothetical protein
MVVKVVNAEVVDFWIMRLVRLMRYLSTLARYVLGYFGDLPLILKVLWWNCKAHRPHHVIFFVSSKWQW